MSPVSVAPLGSNASSNSPTYAYVLHHIPILGTKKYYPLLVMLQCQHQLREKYISLISFSSFPVKSASTQGEFSSTSTLARSCLSVAAAMHQVSMVLVIGEIFLGVFPTTLVRTVERYYCRAPCPVPSHRPSPVPVPYLSHPCPPCLIPVPPVPYSVLYRSQRGTGTDTIITFIPTTTTHPPLNFSKPLRAFIQYS